MSRAGMCILAVSAMVLVSADLHAVAFFSYSENFVADPAGAAHWRSSFLDDTAGDAEYFDMNNNAYIFTDPAKHGLSYGIEPTFLNTDPDFAANNAPAIQAIRNAFATWDIASDTLDLFDAGIDPLGGDGSHVFAGLNIDVFSAPSNALNPVTGTALFGVNTLAVTDVYFWSIDHTIATINMWFNEAKPWSATGAGSQYDLESVALHEIGHILGLNHPNQADDVSRNWDADLLPLLVPVGATGQEVMNSTLGMGVVKRTLTDDELYGLAFLMGEEVGDGDPAEGGEVPEPSTLLLLLPLVGFGLKRLSFAGKKR